MKQYKLKKNYIDSSGCEFSPQEVGRTGNFFIAWKNIEDKEASPFVLFEKDFVKSNTEFFEEIIEKPKDILRWPNGAVMEIPDDIEEVFKVFPRDTRYTWDTYSGESCKEYCKISNSIFLLPQEAQEECEAKNIRARLMRKIKEIDRENGWVCDWNNRKQKKYFLFISSCKDCYDISTGWDFCLFRPNVMSEQAKNYMMSDAVSDREFKMFLGIKE